MTEAERVLIVGGGGREHALGWKINQSPSNPKLFFAPGNAGTSKIGRNVDIGAADVERLLKFASDNKIRLTVVGPEAPLAKGIGDIFRENNLPIFAPTEKAARLETSKSWAIDFMDRHNIPHPKSVVIADPHVAIRFFDKPVWNDIVIKADGLASGKGVFLPNSKEEAMSAIRCIMIDKEFDDGSKVIIQERLRGREMSLLVFTDGRTIVPLLPAQDYKRLKDGNKGPNTGGMGTFAPAPMTAGLYKEIHDTILKPTVDGMRKEGKLFQGVLYVGLMLTADGPKVLEYNARFGDPETQVLMMLLKSNLLQALKNTIEGRLTKSDIVFRGGAAVCVVLAVEGYPGKPKTGDRIYGLEKINDSDIQVFHAGTKLVNGQMETDGGRIFGLTSYGKDNKDARKKLSPLIGENGVHFREMQYRKDISI